MIKAFYLDAAPPDELIGLYARTWITEGEQIVWHGSHKLAYSPAIKHIALPSFDASAAAATLRALLYRRQNLANLDAIVDSKLIIFGFNGLTAWNKEIHAHPNATVVVTRLPANTPAAFKHRCAALPASVRFIVPTKTIAASMMSWGVEESRINRALPQFPPAPEQKPRPFTTPGFLVGVICPLAAEQGLETVIQAVQQAEVFIPDLKVFVIGDGPDKRRFSWLLAQTHLKDRMQIGANAADYQRFLHHLDVCIAPAVHDEGCDPVVLHALAQGNAVVATDIPSHAEFIENGKTGLLYEAGNSHTLSQHLINLYTHRDWLEHYKRAIYSNDSKG